MKTKVMWSSEFLPPEWRLKHRGPTYLRKAKLVRLSVCECGFPLVKVSIALGKIYEYLPIFASSTLTCGGCRKDIKLWCVKCSNGEFFPMNALEPIVEGDEDYIKNQDNQRLGG